MIVPYPPRSIKIIQIPSPLESILHPPPKTKAKFIVKKVYLVNLQPILPTILSPSIFGPLPKKEIFNQPFPKLYFCKSLWSSFLKSNAWLDRTFVVPFDCSNTCYLTLICSYDYPFTFQGRCITITQPRFKSLFSLIYCATVI